MTNIIHIEEEMKIYLESTSFCDWDNPQFYKLVREIIGDSESEKEIILKIFYFVRDNILFSIRKLKTRASQTLKSLTGECGTKTNTHIALLRTAGIPARFHCSKCQIEPLKGVIPKWLFSRMPPIASHFWPEVYLSGKWTACEGLLDKDLYLALLNLGYITKKQIPTIDWDGKNDLILFKPWIVEDLGTLASYDEVYEIMNKNRKEEGMPPRIIEHLLGWIFYSSFKHRTDKLRRTIT